MKRVLSRVACGILATVCGTAYGQSTLIDDFDGGGVAAGSRVISPVPGTYTTSGRMFEVGNRANTLTNGQSLPFAMSDDSVVPAQGSTVFAGDTAGVFGQNKTGSFFGVVDTVEAVNPSGIGTVTWTINTTGLSSLQLQVDVGAMGDFEGTAAGGGAVVDTYSFAVSFDNGANFTTVMLFGADDAVVAGTYSAMDSGTVNTSLADPLYYLGPDGVLGGGDDLQMDKSDPATGALDTLTANIAGTGESMILRFSANADANAEAFAFDNLRLLSSVAVNDADFDSDEDVDGADFLTWQRGLRNDNTGTLALGDANGDLNINAADLAIWKGQFPPIPPISAVPEPASMGLLALGLAAVAAGRRRK